MAGTDLADGDVIAATATAPELEFVTEQAVQILGAVVSSDVATLVETGAVGCGGRSAELTSLVEDLSTVSGTLADQTDELVRGIDARDGATATHTEERRVGKERGGTGRAQGEAEPKRRKSKETE